MPCAAAARRLVDGGTLENLMSWIWNLPFLAVSILVAPPAQALTWSLRDIEDPIKPGATCRVAEPMSYGSYIFQSPSKYDLVFWPMTDLRSIGFCKESGFAAYAGDFEGLTNAEKAAIRSLLAASYRPGTRELSLFDALLLVEQSYSLRKKDRAFRIRLLRALAFMYEEGGHFARAKVLREQALAAVRTALNGPLNEQERLEYLFVCAAYEREFGRRKESDACLRLLDEALARSKDEKLKRYVEYLSELKADIPLISPGGTLAPKARGQGR
jgi:hypothetical protein